MSVQCLCMGPVGEFKVLGFVQRICSKDLIKGFVQRICSKDLLNYPHVWLALGTC